MSDKLQNIKFKHDMFTQRKHCKLIVWDIVTWHWLNLVLPCLLSVLCRHSPYCLYHLGSVSFSFNVHSSQAWNTLLYTEVVVLYKFTLIICDPNSLRIYIRWRGVSLTNWDLEKVLSCFIIYLIKQPCYVIMLFL